MSFKDDIYQWEAKRDKIGRSISLWEYYQKGLNWNGHSWIKDESITTFQQWVVNCHVNYGCNYFTLIAKEVRKGEYKSFYYSFDELIKLF